MKGTLSHWRLAWKGLLQHRRSHVAVALSTVVAAAVITGALIVGDSIRGSLEDRVRERLGHIDSVLVAPRFFRADLASQLWPATGPATGPATLDTARRAAGAILLRGAVVAADSQRRLGEVNVIAIDDRFWHFWAGTRPAQLENTPGPRRAIVNASVAESLGVAPGAALLVYTSREGEVPAESAFGQREGTVRPMRVELERVLPDEGLALFGLEHGQATVRNVFVSLGSVQRLLKKKDQINTLLVGTNEDDDLAGNLDEELRKLWTLADAGLRVDARVEKGYVALESEELLLPKNVGAAAREAAVAVRAERLEILTYLANTISIGPGEIPYSTVAAVGAWKRGTPPPGESPGTGRPVELPGNSASLLEKPGGILLSDWAAPDLMLETGTTVTLSYYAPSVEDEIEERTVDLTLRGTTPLDGVAADPGWTPTYPGITDSLTLRGWDPPFPVDMDRIRERDEEFWDAHRATPKAFISLRDGSALWGSRFGVLTSLRVRPTDGQGDLAQLAVAFEKALLDRLAPQELGWNWLHVKEEGLAAAHSGTDFTGLFIGFSFFLITAALVLLSIVFRLSCDHRSRELGVLAASGYAPRDLTRTVLTETGLVIAASAAVGSACGLAYASGLVAGLRGWWKDAVNAPFLRMHVHSFTVASGGVAAALLALATVYVSVRRLSRLRPAQLVAGGAGDDVSPTRGGRQPVSLGVLLVGMLVGCSFLAVGSWSDALPTAAAFFLAGASLLAAGLAAVHLIFGRKPPALSGSGLRAVAILGVRNWSRSPTRSVLTVALLACAAFTIVAVAASRRQPGSAEPEKNSGDGGFALVGRAALPVYASLNAASGRESLRPETARLVAKAGVFAFRSRPGDDASCRNVYRPQTPRLLGAPAEFVARGGFAWAGSIATTPAEKANPWALLDHEFPDGAIPTIGDAATVQWILHSGLGKDIQIKNDRGQEVHLRLVALAAHSIFQGELIIGREQFLEHFPNSPGDRFFLIEAAGEDVEATTTHLEQDWADYGLDLETTGALLASYQAVENTYMSTFQLLGGLGLVLGTLGLAAVLYRNSIERRGELALLRAVGFPRRTVAWMVLSETCFLLILGVGVGTAAALVGVVPQQGLGNVPWTGLGATLLGTVFVGLLAAAVSVRAALASPLLPALRDD